MYVTFETTLVGMWLPFRPVVVFFKRFWFYWISGLSVSILLAMSDSWSSLLSPSAVGSVQSGNFRLPNCCSSYSPTCSASYFANRHCPFECSIKCKNVSFQCWIGINRFILALLPPSDWFMTQQDSHLFTTCRLHGWTSISVQRCPTITLL